MDCCLKLANVDFVEPTRFQKGDPMMENELSARKLLSHFLL